MKTSTGTHTKVHHEIPEVISQKEAGSLPTNVMTLTSLVTKVILRLYGYKHELNHNQLSLLIYLAEHSHVQPRMGELGKLLNAPNAAAISNMVQGMKELGYITKGTIQGDERGRTVIITEKGLQAADDYRKHIDVTISNLSIDQEALENNLSETCSSKEAE